MDSNFAKKTGDWQTKGWSLASGPMGIKLNDTVSQSREVNYVNNKQLLEKYRAQRHGKDRRKLH